MIPMFRVFASGTCRATVVPTLPGLPLEMAEGAVRLGHLVRVFSSLDRRAEAIHGVDELGGQLLAHALAAALAGRLDEPAHAEREAAIAPDLDRDLICGATDAARLDFDDRGGVAHRRLEDLEAGPARLGLRAGEGLAQDALREVLLAALHQLRREAMRDAVGRHDLVLGLAGDARSTRHLLHPALAGSLGAVLAATLLAVAHAGSVEGAADDVVLDRREVLDAAAANEDHRVLLEVVADARDVGRDLHLVGQAHARDLAQRGVRLLGRHRPDLQADPALLRGALDRHLAASQAVPVLAHGRRLDLLDLVLPAVAHELTDRRHEDVSFRFSRAGAVAVVE